MDTAKDMKTFNNMLIQIKREDRLRYMREYTREWRKKQEFNGYPSLEEKKKHEKKWKQEHKDRWKKDLTDVQEDQSKYRLYLIRHRHMNMVNYYFKKGMIVIFRDITEDGKIITKKMIYEITRAEAIETASKKREKIRQKQIEKYFEIHAKMSK